MKVIMRIFAMQLVLVMLMCFAGCAGQTNTTGNNMDSQGTTVTPSSIIESTSAPTENEDEPDVYVISGVWKFNDTITTIEFENPDEIPEGIPESMHTYSMTMRNITYSCNGRVYEDGYIEVIDTIAGTVEVLISAGNVYNSIDGWRKSYQTVDFGDIPQEVSKDFYNWMKANAVKQ